VILVQFEEVRVTRLLQYFREAKYVESLIKKWEILTSDWREFAVKISEISQAIINTLWTRQ
jgi:hypothetical protein